MADTPKLLVIDDEMGIREGIKRALTPQGFAVETAENGEQGLEKVQSSDYDLVLVDVMMPGTTGIDLLFAIRARDPDLVCIVVTGYATVELAVRAIKQGAYDFLTKPFSVDELLQAVNQGLERRRLSLDAKRMQAAEAEARRLAQEKARLEELDKAKRQFIRLVTHELQAPVAGIQNYLQLILDGYVPPEKLRDVIEKCMARAQEEMDLVADLLELGRLQTVPVPTQMARAHLDDALNQVMDSLQHQAAHKNLRISVELAGVMPPIKGTADQFKSVWTNLIGNAIKYTPSGGLVTVSLRSGDDLVIGEVRDTGIGIPAEDQKRLFTEFFRAENAKSLNIRGTGLGLAIVRQIVEGSGGKIVVESETGRGSTFTFMVPVAWEGQTG